MNTPSKIALVLACAASYSVLAKDTSSYIERWQRLSHVTENMLGTPEGNEYNHVLLQVHNTFFPDIAEKCIARAKNVGANSFDAIVAIDASGLVMDFLPLPDSENLHCFTDSMVGKRYPPPPSAPFYVRFTVLLNNGAT
jgi:hypothetical protein